MLARPELRQLAQRVIARYHLGPLAKQEVADYVRHRLGVAGTQRKLFPDSLMKSLYRLSGGTPRVINVLCDRALLGAYVQAKERVDRATLKQAAREVFHNRRNDHAASCFSSCGFAGFHCACCAAVQACCSVPGSSQDRSQNRS